VPGNFVILQKDVLFVMKYLWFYKIFYILKNGHETLVVVQKSANIYCYESFMVYGITYKCICRSLIVIFALLLLEQQGTSDIIPILIKRALTTYVYMYAFVCMQ